MDLSQTIFNYLQDFSNITNEIRAQAEENVNNLISQNPFDVINSLFEIIRIDPSKKEAYFCAILVRNYLRGENIVDISQNSPDFYQHMKNTLMEFASDSRFPQNLNILLISDILYLFYSLSIIQEDNSFPEYIPFLISLLDDNNYRSNVLETLSHTIFLDSLEICHPQIIEKCDLFSDDFEYRSKSFCFLINSIRFESFDFQDFFQNIVDKIPEIFDGMPDKQFNECLIWTFEIYQMSEKYNQLSLFFPSFLLLIFPRLHASNLDELATVNLINHITSMLSSTLFFNFILHDDISNRLIEAISMSLSDPIQFPNLYYEIDILVKKLYTDFFNNQPLIKCNARRQNFLLSIQELENSPNLFIASLFAKYSIDISNIEQALEYATIEDDPQYSNIIIRHNGLKQLKKIIDKFNKYIDDEMKIELFDTLMNLYEFYEDEQIMKVITFLSSFFSEELIQAKCDDIFELCEKKITTQIICCATLYCLNKQSEESENLSGLLFQASIDLTSHDISALSNVLSYLSTIIESAGPESTFSFIEQVMPVILDDPLCFTNKLLQDFIQCAQEYDESAEFASEIFMKLMEFIENTDNDDLLIDENIENYCRALKNIPFYTKYIPDFENNYLKDVINIVEKRIDDDNFNIKAKSISCISRLSDYYCLNTDMLNEIIEKFLNIFRKEEYIYVIKCILSSLSRIIYSIIIKNQNETLDQFINLYPLLFETSYNRIISIQQNDKVIDNMTIFDIACVIKKLNELFNIFLQKNPEMTIDLALTFFLKSELNEEDGFRFSSPGFQSFFVNIWAAILLNTNIELFEDDAPEIVQILIDCAFDQSSNDIPNRINALSSLSTFFDQNEMPTEMISDFIWNGLVPLIDDNKLNLDQNDEKSNKSRRLLQAAISSLIIISTRYCNDEINFKSAIPIVVENINYLFAVYKLTLERLFELVNICLSEEEISSNAFPILSKVTCLVQDRQVEKSAVESIFNEFQKSSEISDIFNPLYQAILEQMNTDCHEE